MSSSPSLALQPVRWWQITLITLGAIGLYLGMRWLPTGTNLHQGDFRTGGANALEFCDPASPQFIPVVERRSPVAMAISSENPAMSGQEGRFTVSLRTASGKPIGPQDLLIQHTRKLHLLLIDPGLEDYQHLHPEPGDRPGDWVFSLTPQRAGDYRVFADFVPTATSRGLYASVDLAVAAAPHETVSGPSLSLEETGEQVLAGYRFRLQSASGPLRAGTPGDLVFSVRHVGGEAVPLELVMDAYAHLVAFDLSRSGFAHLHPNETSQAAPLDPLLPQLTFQITIPTPGRYIVWAQVSLAGVERFVPFSVLVVP